ncbi:hypothetical protein [Roseospirillum parvum]|uniref:Uncharacterized protein n=1 Tax=Roseospirillum parvum TaxID=83401 RepID=A0A1G8D207_9PROT|nr:hypothetical protein [Roseospirillum parvum]SDH51785.1 hypothetical protein SAMN05421742_107159 [Roseospirillum parvum]
MCSPTHPHDDRARRRAALTVRPNPRPASDYLVDWRRTVALPDGAPLAGRVGLAVAYVPDRLILEAAGLTAALDLVAAQPWPDLESLAVAFHDDLLNALVPRWLCLKASHGTAGARHRVTVEERQPGWANPALTG